MKRLPVHSCVHFIQPLKIDAILPSKQLQKLCTIVLKKKCLKNETYENFFEILEKHNLKLGFKSYIPFLNSDLKKAFNSFEILYSDYEMQMKEKGEI